MSRILGLPRNAALALLAIFICAFFLLLALVIPWPGTNQPSPVATGPALQVTADRNDPARPASPQSAPAPDALFAPPSAAKTVNLLELVNPVQNAVVGQWVMEGDTLKNTTSGRSQIEFPYAPPAEYDYRVIFQRDQGNGFVALICAAGGSQFIWRMNPNGNSGFALVDGKGFNNNRSSVQSVPWSHNGQPDTLVLRFRADHVDVFLDDQPVTTLQTNYQDMHSHANFQQPHDNTLGFFASEPLTIQSAQVIEITGTGTRIH